MHQSAAVCRICLAVDALVSNIDGTALQLVYERLTGALLVSGDRPVAACYICRALLNKSHKLMVTATRADNILTAMLERDGEITENSISLIDREAIGLCASLSFSVAEPESEDAGYTAIPWHEVKPEPESEDAVDIAMPCHKVKPEPESEDAGLTAMPWHEVKTEPESEDAVDAAMNVEDPAGVPAADVDDTRDSDEDAGAQGGGHTTDEEEIDVVSIGTSQQLLPATSHVRTDISPRARSAQKRKIFQWTEASTITPRSLRKRPLRLCRKRPRRRRPASESDSGGSCPEAARRALHSDSERRRRIGLRHRLEQLQQQLPAARHKQRAPKVLILREAAALCRTLRAEQKQRELLADQQTTLLAKLQKLYADFFS